MLILKKCKFPLLISLAGCIALSFSHRSFWFLPLTFFISFGAGLMALWKGGQALKGAKNAENVFMFLLVVLIVAFISFSTFWEFSMFFNAGCLIEGYCLGV